MESVLIRRAARLLVGAAGTCLSAQVAFAVGTWTSITNTPPAAVGLMILLSDGTVMCSNQNGSTIGSAWYKLTPNAAGSYQNGTWTTLATMPHTRLYFQTQVLKDGRVYCSGGEYGTGGPFAEVYNPQTNVWTDVTPGGALWNSASDNFYDCNSEILPDGKVLLMPVFPHTSGAALRYDPAGNTWSSGGTLVRGSYQDEASWVKLPDNTILTIDPFGNNTYGNNPSERYNPPTNTWINDGVCPVNMYDPFGFELGGAVFLPNGKAFFIGAIPNTALYTPSGSTSAGTWAAGPAIPLSKGAPDAPSALMVDGKVLCALSPQPTSGNHFPTPTTFHEYDYVSNTFSAVIASPAGLPGTTAPYQCLMLCLPNGQVMFSFDSTAVRFYTPSGSPQAAWKPTITGITSNGDGSFHMTGTQLNGIWEGASYGDDWQMNTNYPIVRINHSNGNVYYARTYNWTSTSITPGLASSTEYKPPAGMPAGAYTLVVTANGIASDAATAPSITSQPVSQQHCWGTSVSFSVTASGVGPFSYQWRRGVTNLVDGGNIGGSTTATLTFTPPTPSDADTNYNCVVTNVLGSATSNNASLTVCVADFNCDGFVTGDDFDAFAIEFDAGTDAADVNHDGFTTGDDFDYFSAAFDAGC